MNGCSGIHNTGLGLDLCMSLWKSVERSPHPVLSARGGAKCGVLQGASLQQASGPLTARQTPPFSSPHWECLQTPGKFPAKFSALHPLSCTHRQLSRCGWEPSSAHVHMNAKMCLRLERLTPKKVLSCSVGLTSFETQVL